MNKIKRFELQITEPVYAELDPELNKEIVETAGFVPLEVKFKRFEEAGIMMQYQMGEFTSSDYREMYLSEDFEITPEDDLEDIQEKLVARQVFMDELKKAKSDGQKNPAAPDNVVAGTEEPKLEETETSAKAE